MNRPPAPFDRPASPYPAAPTGVSTALVNAPSRAAERRASKPGFVTGVKAFLWGTKTLITTPSLWPLALVPVLLACVLTVVLGALGVKLAGWLVTSTLAVEGAWRVALEIVFSVVAVVLAFFAALGLAQPLSGPALEGLVRRVEKQLGQPERPTTPFLVDMGRSLASALLGAGFGLPFLLLALLLNFVPGGSLVAFPLKLVVVTIALAWDLCDYPLSVRGLSISARVRFIVHHFWSVLGFSIGISLVALIPCVGLLLLPAGVCGATRLLHDIERHDRNLAG